MESLADLQMVVLSTDDVVIVKYISAWHAKIMADSKTGLVDFHLREQQAHEFLGKVLSILDV